MRVIYLILLLILLSVVGIFVLQNQGAVTLRFLDRGITTTLALMTLAVYFLGMLTGWFVVGFLRKSIRRVSEQREG